jgi:uncharacterized metal-binding protein YceD (DUF177 family)
VAKLVGLRALPRLEATFDLAPEGPRRLRVTGCVAATVEQTCVVTLEGIENEVKEQVNLVFAPPHAASADGEIKRAGAESLDLDVPEPLIGETIDLGGLITETLILGIDPYPRKPGAEFEAPPVADTGPHPFAALEALKKGGAGKND